MTEQIRLADILSATEVVLQKEAYDRAVLDTINQITFDMLKTNLIQWATAGFPNAHPIHMMPVSPPELCSDGVRRTLGDYVTFLMGRTIGELIAGLQARCPDFEISYATTGREILIVVTKP
jgi:hypothetical protein